MKHYSAAELVPEALLTEEELAVELAARLDGRRGQNGRLAEQLGITRVELSTFLNGKAALRPGVAAALGYRKVARFEKLATPAERIS
jgi:plasmid maintenance system antidote protein VapI